MSCRCATAGPTAWRVLVAGEAYHNPKIWLLADTRHHPSQPCPGLTLQAASQVATSWSLLGPLATSSSFVTLNERTVSCSD